MCLGSTLQLPTKEYRFIGENISVDYGKKVYIDPSAWCVHGEYEAYEKYIVTKSNVTAHLAQIHPFTFGWTSDIHMGCMPTRDARVQNWVSDAKKGIDRLGLCNPTLTAVGGDMVEPSLEGLWFEDIWNYVKDRLSNNLWVKGNHDVGGELLFCYHYYDWFERLWCLRLGNFEFISFDTFNERIALPGSCYPGISLHDLIWLKKRLHENSLYKVMLFHHPLSQWHFNVHPYALNENSNVKCAFFGHDPKINYEEFLNIPCYSGGEVAPSQPVISFFTKSGDMHAIRVKGDVEIVESFDGIKIKAPAISSFNREVKSVVPIRLVKQLRACYLNLIALCPPESQIHIQIIERRGNTFKVTGDTDMYIIGKEIYSMNDAYDSWKCSCGAMWNSYYVSAENPLNFNWTPFRCTNSPF
ncbi:MAG: metallophosphoesterase [Candidatus Bathyarchaeia archaeon]